MCKDTNLKAIHNRHKQRFNFTFGCLSLCKDTNLKAIHNVGVDEATKAWGCLSLCKDTNLKAIHNAMQMQETPEVVVLACVKIQI